MIGAFDPIGSLEASLVDRIGAAFADGDGRSALKKVEAIEVPIDPQTEKTFRLTAPSVYVVPLLVRATDVPGVIDIRFACYCISDRATSITRGTGGAAPLGIGSYAIATRTALVLDIWQPPVEGAGTMRLVGIENITGLAFVSNKSNVWAVTVACEVGCALDNPHPGPDAADPDGSDLGDFLIFHADIDVPPFEDPPETLPAARDAALRAEPQT